MRRRVWRQYGHGLLVILVVVVDILSFHFYVACIVEVEVVVVDCQSPRGRREINFNCKKKRQSPHLTLILNPWFLM